MEVPQPIQLLTACLIASTLFGLMGFTLHLLANRRAYKLYRTKGYLRPPTGWQWVHFMRLKHYDDFSDSGVRAYFSCCRACMAAMLISLLISFIIGLSFVVLQNVSGGP